MVSCNFSLKLGFEWGICGEAGCQAYRLATDTVVRNTVRIQYLDKRDKQESTGDGWLSRVVLLRVLSACVRDVSSDDCILAIGICGAVR